MRKCADYRYANVQIFNVSRTRAMQIRYMQEHEYADYITP